MHSAELSARVVDGLRVHLDGDIEQAGRIYSEVLSHDPLRADALHLFGVVLFQLGDPHSALDAITRAVALWPNMAHFHANLGEVYRALGRLDRAAGCFVLALKLRPDRFESLADVDLLLRRPGQFDNLPLPGPAHTELVPPAAIAATDRGFQLQSEGSHGAAVESFVKAAQLAPGVGLIESNLGQALLEVKRTREALYHCQESVRLSPDLPEAWDRLGSVYEALGRSIEARTCYLEALRINPDSSVVMNSLGRVLGDALCTNEAQVWFRLALQGDPDSVVIRSNLAWVLRELGCLDEAAALCRGTLENAPDAAEAHVCLGSIYHDQRRMEEARTHFRFAIEANPKFLLAHQSQGILLSEMGDLAGAELAFREVLKHPGHHSRALSGLANILRGKLPEADFAAIQRGLADPDLSDNARAELHFAASTVCDARRDISEAAHQLRQANGIRHAENYRTGRGYGAADHERFANQMMETCSSDYFERVLDFGLASERPVFIFGLPRSGTSLTEQILASHSNVFGLGETDLSRAGFVSLPELLGDKREAVEILAEIDRATTRKLAQSHLDKLEAVKSSARFLADKLPDNYLYLGYLATLFPNARFIHCRRDLRDVAVSCWATNFWYLDWPNSLDHIASRFAAYQQMMAHWEEVFPVPILHVDYESTVDDLESTARKLVDWCGLDWEPACLSFHESNRVVRTASVTQVRQPLYRRSVGRWKNYEADLGSLFERLEGLVKV